MVNVQFVMPAAGALYKAYLRRTQYTAQLQIRRLLCCLIKKYARPTPQLGIKAITSAHEFKRILAKEARINEYHVIRINKQ